MEEEKEIKIEILDKDRGVEEIKKIIEKNLGVKFSTAIKTKDCYFDSADKNLFNLNHAFRIRDANNSSLAYKARFFVPERKENPWFILEKDLNFPLNKEDLISFLNLANKEIPKILPGEITRENIEEILNQLNLNKSIIINKKRYIASTKDYSIFLDDVESLGVFVEIEASNNDLDLKKILSKIEFNYKQILLGYTNLYAERILKMKIPDFDKKHKKDPDWNYLPGQKEIVMRLINNI